MKFPRVVYLIENTETGRKYVGSSSKPHERFYSHMREAMNKNHSVPLMNEDFEKYGFGSFKFSFLDVINGRDERRKEYQWQERLNTRNEESGYNYLDRGKAYE